jgi:N-ethylmaleimide reductase
VRLFSSFPLGKILLPNRIVMAPLSRGRAAPDGVPTVLNALYYSQRAGAGLIVAEGAEVTPRSADRLQLHNSAQARGWRLVTDAVHAAGGHIVLQLCHSGTADETTAADYAGLARIFAQSARYALEAGFDGIEIHGGPKHLVGGLLHQQRAGRRNASYRDRTEALFAILDYVAPIWSPERVGVRLSLDDFAASPQLLDHVAVRMQARGIGYLHAIQGAEGLPPSLRAHFRGAVILAGRFDRYGAEEALASGEADLIAFGMPFVANPDLVARLRQDSPLAMADVATLRSSGAEGYTDYPPMLPAIAEASSSPAG